MYNKGALGENLEPPPIAFTLGNLGSSSVACMNQPIHFHEDGSLEISISCPAGTVL